jgi:hypothetical protein
VRGSTDSPRRSPLLHFVRHDMSHRVHRWCLHACVAVGQIGGAHHVVALCTVWLFQLHAPKKYNCYSYTHKVYAKMMISYLDFNIWLRK